MEKSIMKKYVVLSLLLCAVSACSGMQKTGDTFTVHSESFNIVGFQIPGGEYAKARSMVPAGAEVHTVHANPSDWDSLLGVLNRIIGVSYTEISGKTTAK